MPHICEIKFVLSFLAAQQKNDDDDDDVVEHLNRNCIQVRINFRRVRRVSFGSKPRINKA